MIDGFINCEAKPAAMLPRSLTRIWGYLPAACRRLRVALLCERKPGNRHDEEPMNHPG